jgi:GNAT superfamily N-acetyltransferase
MVEVTIEEFNPTNETHLDGVIAIENDFYNFQNTDADERVKGRRVRYTREEILGKTSGENIVNQWVARIENGKVVGYARILRAAENRKALDFSRIGVKPKYRGQGIGKKLLQTRREFAKTQEHDYTCGHCLTIHTGSQKLFAGISTSLNLTVMSWGGVLEANIPFSYVLVVDDNQGKIKDSEQAVYVPEQHRKLLSVVYGNLGATRNYQEGFIPEEEIEKLAEDLEKAKTGIDRSIKEWEGYGEFGYLRTPIRLRLDKPTTPAKMQFLEERGFYLCGIVPMAPRLTEGRPASDMAIYSFAGQREEVDENLVKVLPEHEPLKRIVINNYWKAREVAEEKGLLII